VLRLYRCNKNMITFNLKCFAMLHLYPDDFYEAVSGPYWGAATQRAISLRWDSPVLRRSLISPMRLMLKLSRPTQVLPAAPDYPVPTLAVLKVPSVRYSINFHQNISCCFF
jgi:hypothetical protein